MPPFVITVHFSPNIESDSIASTNIPVPLGVPVTISTSSSPSTSTLTLCIVILSKVILDKMSSKMSGLKLTVFAIYFANGLFSLIRVS